MTLPPTVAAPFPTAAAIPAGIAARTGNGIARDSITGGWPVIYVWDMFNMTVVWIAIIFYVFTGIVPPTVASSLCVH